MADATNTPIGKAVVKMAKSQDPGMTKAVPQLQPKTSPAPLKPMPAQKPIVTPSVQQLAKVPSFRKGGKVRKTGLYKLHKGEKVTPASKSR